MKLSKYEKSIFKEIMKLNKYEKMVTFVFKEMRKNKMEYHNQTHIEDVLLKAHEVYKDPAFNHIKKARFDISNVKGKLSNQVLIMPLSVFLALLFHDIVYKPDSSENEKESATFFYCYICENYQSIMYENTYDINLAYEYILATKDHDMVADKYDSEEAIQNGHILLDIDMSILASDYKTFKKYNNNILKEYQKVYSKKQVEKGRLEFLTQLSHSEIFKTDLFSEVDAQNNIRRLIEEKKKKRLLKATFFIIK